VALDLRFVEFGTAIGRRAIDAAHVATHPLAGPANRLIHAYDDFLRHHGVGSAMRMPGPLTVELSGDLGVASAPGLSTMQLGGDPAYLARPSAHSAEMVGHELTHRELRAPSQVAEAFADDVSVAFARRVGAPLSDNWIAGDDALLPFAQRDLQHPRFATVDEVAAYVSGPRDPIMPTASPLDHDVHATGGPISRAMALLGERTSSNVADDVFVGAHRSRATR